MVTTRVYLCPICHATAEERDKMYKWRYANPYNSTHFCRRCGSAMSPCYLTDEEISRYEKEHEAWLMEGDNDKKWY